MKSQSQNSAEYWSKEEQVKLIAKAYHEKFLNECRKTSTGKVHREPLASIEPECSKFSYKALYEYNENKFPISYLNKEREYSCLSFVLRLSGEKQSFLENGFNFLSQCSSVLEPIHLELIGMKNAVFWQVKHPKSSTEVIKNAIKTFLPTTQIIEDDYFKSQCNSSPTEMFTYIPQPPYYRNLIVPKSKSNLSLLALLSAFEQLNDDEWFLYRLTIEPANIIWANNCQNLYTYEKEIFKMYKDFSLEEGNWFINPTFESKQAIGTKLSPDSLPLFFVSPSIFINASDNQISTLKSVFNQFRFGDQFYNELSNEDFSVKQIEKTFHNNLNYVEGHLLNREELSHLFLLPCESSFQKFGHLFKLPQTETKDKKGIILGKDNTSDVILPFENLEYSCAILGNQGMGKSTLLLSMLSQVSKADYGMIIFNLHDRDFINTFISSLSEEKRQDVIIASPILNGKLLARNVVDATDSKITRLSADLAYAIENATAGLGVNIKMNLKNALLMLLAYPGEKSLEDILAVLDRDDPLGRKIRTYYKNKTKSKQVLKLIQKIENRGIDLSAIQNKIQNLLDHEDTASLYSYTGKNKLNYKEIVENKKILIWDLTGTGSAGDSLASLEISLIHKTFQQFGKVIPTPVHKTLLVIDEVQRIQAQGILDSLREDRKFGLYQILATQSLLGAEPSIIKVFNLIANLISFQCPEYDAKFIASKTSGAVKPSDIMMLDKYEVITRLLTSLNVSKTKTQPFPKPQNSCLESTINHSLDLLYVDEDMDYCNQTKPSVQKKTRTTSLKSILKNF